MLKQTIQLFGTSGMVEQDDSDTWPHMTLSAKGAMGRKMTLKYQAVFETAGAERVARPGHRQRRLHQGRHSVALVAVLARADDGRGDESLTRQGAGVVSCFKHKCGQK